jgi:hypothetical protein
MGGENGMPEQMRGVKLFDTEGEANRWIEANPDRKIIDVKVTSCYNYHEEVAMLAILILWGYE